MVCAHVICEFLFNASTFFVVNCYPHTQTLMGFMMIIIIMFSTNDNKKDRGKKERELKYTKGSIL